MTIDSRWLKKDFKQKYFLYCREKKLESGSLIKKYSNLLAQNKNNHYVCKVIKIIEL